MSGGRRDWTTSADRALAHVEYLVGQCPGLTTTHVMKLAGLAHSTYTHMTKTGRIAIEGEERILAVEPRHVALSPPARVPSAPLSDILRRLMREAGVAIPAVSRVTGLPAQTINGVLKGRATTTAWRVNCLIRSLTVDDLRAYSTWCDRRKTIVRIRAMQANGWTLVHQSEMTGHSISVAVNERSDRPIRRDLAEAVERVYLDLGDRRGPSDRARGCARRLGFQTPIHYDDDMNLIEVEDVDEDDEATKARVTLRILGLTLDGRSVPEIMEAIGTTVDRRISAARREHGLSITRNFAGEYVPAEVVPGIIAVIREAIKGVHYRTDLDVLDDPGTDYVALLRTVREAADPEVVDRAA